MNEILAIDTAIAENLQGTLNFLNTFELSLTAVGMLLVFFALQSIADLLIERENENYD